MSDLKPKGNHRFKSAKIAEAIAADLEMSVKAAKAAAEAYRDGDHLSGEELMRSCLHYMRVVSSTTIMQQARENRDGWRTR